MRLDKYLKVSRLIKRRTVANEACDEACILVNGREQKAGYQVHIDHVIGIYMEDRCGGLNEILQAITDSNINIHYIYISYDRENASPIAIMKTSGYAEVESCLRSKGYRLL